MVFQSQIKNLEAQKNAEKLLVDMFGNAANGNNENEVSVSDHLCVVCMCDHCCLFCRK